MDIQQLRGWADVMDKALVISVIVAVLAVIAVGVSAWFSVRFAGALRTQESIAFDRYKSEWGRHAAQLEADAVRATERVTQLEKAVAAADERAAQAGRDHALANARVSASEREATRARQRVVELEKLAEQASARRSVTAAAESAAQVPEAAKTPEVTATAPDTAKAPEAVKVPEAVKAPDAETESRSASAASAKSPIVDNLSRYGGTKAALYVVDEAPDAAAIASSINAILADAGWAAQAWRWTGVGGILGVVVLIKDGSDAATDQAASGLVDALRSDGFNAAKGNWPADWRRFRGTLHGPETPSATDAPIRVVIGAKAR